LEQEQQETQAGLINFDKASAMCKANLSVAVVWLYLPHVLQQHTHSADAESFKSVSCLKRFDAGTSCESCFVGILWI
jgi:hypothetical protein